MDVPSMALRCITLPYVHTVVGACAGFGSEELPAETVRSDVADRPG